MRNEEWGMGNGEWGLSTLFLIPDPYFLGLTNFSAMRSDSPTVGRDLNIVSS
jgi:hypothetical protein